MGDGITIGMSFESATSLNNRFSNRTGIKPDYMRRQAEGGISDRTLYKDKKDVVYAEYTNFSGGDVAKYNKKYNKNLSVNVFTISKTDKTEYFSYRNNAFNINGKVATDLSYDYVETRTQFAKDLNGNHKVDRDEIFWKSNGKRVYGNK